jgi:hypothetical protein
MTQRNVTIKTEGDLREFVKAVIGETSRATLYRRSLREKEMQQAASTPEEGTEEAPDQQAAPVKGGAEDDSDAMKKGDIAYEDIVDKLNTVRSGKSFKDSAIASAMQKYIEDMSAAERTALFAFLKGIAQIVTGEVPGEKAIEPSDAPAKVTMDKKQPGEIKKVQIKPVVIKGVPQAKQASKGGEDTTGPTPITPKKR